MGLTKRVFSVELESALEQEAALWSHHIDRAMGRRDLIDRAVGSLTGIPDYAVRNYRGYVVTRPRGWVIDRHALCNEAKGEIRNAR